MASRFVGNPNSAIGSLMKRGMTGTVPTKVQDDKPEEEVIIKVDQPVIEEKSKSQVEALNVLDETLKEFEQETKPDLSEIANESDTGLLSQVVPQVVEKNTDTLNPDNPVGSAGSKESLDTATIDQIAVDAARGAQQVEVEPTPEIPPEVESYLQKVEEHKDTAPEEIVIADGSSTQPVNNNYPSQPVVVLPITPEEEKKGANKNPKFSIRWLVEWSRKIMKAFSGKVIYRFAEEDQK